MLREVDWPWYKNQIYSVYPTRSIVLNFLISTPSSLGIFSPTGTLRLLAALAETTSLQ